MEFIIIFGVCLMWLALVLASALIDRKAYNNGRCKCGGAWKHFDIDSHGVDGYYCEKCGEVIWVKMIHTKMIIDRKEKELVKTIEEVLDGLKRCEKLLCNSCPYDGDENCKSTLIVEARQAIKNVIFDNERKNESVTELIKELNEAYDANRALRVELSANLKHKTTSDMVNHPPHYESGKYECIDVMEEVYGTEIVKNFCLCNAFKYLYRCMHKHDSPTEDTKKSAWYLEKYFELGDR